MLGIQNLPQVIWSSAGCGAYFASASIIQLRRAQEELKGKLVLAQKENEQLRNDAAELPKLRGELVRLRGKLQASTQNMMPADSRNSDGTQAAATSWIARADIEASISGKPAQRHS
jgi:hypothetical protein